jgi:hypothetical protein
MKNKISLYALLGISIAFAIYVYKYPPTKAPMSNDNNICTDYSTDKKSKLTNGLVHDMVHNYRNNQLDNIQGVASKPINDDAYAIWFDLDTIKKFIYHFEHDMKNDATYSNNKRGLRIYYAAYPDSTSWNKNEYKNALTDMLKDPMKRKYENRHTLVMIPTLQTKDGKIIDVNLFDKNTFANGIQKYENVQGTSFMPMSVRGSSGYYLLPTASSTSTTSDDIAARNHGGLYPPDALTDLGF